VSVCAKRERASGRKRERTTETIGEGEGERGKTSERERERGKQRIGGGGERGCKRKHVCVHVYVSVSSFGRIIACVCTHVCARVDLEKMQGGKKW